MKIVLVTGSEGFIGKNLVAALNFYKDIRVKKYDINNKETCLEEYLKEADIVYHLAGVNRPKQVEEFENVNVGLTRKITKVLKKYSKKTPIVFSSSIQTELENPYGISKRKAEKAFIEYSKTTGSKVFIFRLNNVFGKWCRPNYNSVVATFCYNISHGIDIQVADSNKEMKFIYIDDIIKKFLDLLNDTKTTGEGNYYRVEPIFKITLGELAEKIYEFKSIRNTLTLPDMKEDFIRYLYATYTSYLDTTNFSYTIDKKVDNRGELFEIIKGYNFGQIFISKTKPGITRGNHYHATKVEKFCVIQGKAVIKLRQIATNDVVSYIVSDERIEIVDIPPGYTHSIKNIGEKELITLFWANEVFDLKTPDTYYEKVLYEKTKSNDNCRNKA